MTAAAARESALPIGLPAVQIAAPLMFSDEGHERLKN
jgi:hypothetical protein